MITYAAKKKSKPCFDIESFSYFLCQGICLTMYNLSDLLHSSLPGVVKLIPQRFDDAAYKPVFCNKKPEYTTGVIVTL